MENRVPLLRLVLTQERDPLQRQKLRRVCSSLLGNCLSVAVQDLNQLLYLTDRVSLKIVTLKFTSPLRLRETFLGEKRRRTCNDPFSLWCPLRSDQLVVNRELLRVIIAFSEDYCDALSYLPACTRRLIFSSPLAGNFPVDTLPECLTHLTVGRYFNQNVDHLPSTLTHFICALNCRFNQPVDHLPPRLIHLVLESSQFNHPVDQLPCGLLHLTLGWAFHHYLDHLPPDLDTLQVKDQSMIHLDHLPRGLSHLSIDVRHGAINARDFNPLSQWLPQTLTHLTLPDNFDDSVDYLPPSLKVLDLRRARFNQPLDHLTDGLTHLFLGFEFNKPIDHLPSRLTHLWLGYKFNQCVDHLPLTLLELKLGCKFAKHLDHLPPLLRRLNVKSYQMHLFSLDYLPAGLRVLKLKNPLKEYHPNFFSSLDHLPSGLVILVIRTKMTLSIPMDHLPSDLECLALSSNNWIHYCHNLPHRPPRADFKRLFNLR